MPRVLRMMPGMLHLPKAVSAARMPDMPGCLRVAGALRVAGSLRVTGDLRMARRIVAWHRNRPVVRIPREEGVQLLLGPGRGGGKATHPGGGFGRRGFVRLGGWAGMRRVALGRGEANRRGVR